MLNLKNKFKSIKVIGFDLDQTLYPKSPQIDEAIQGYIYKKIADFKECPISEAEVLFKNLYKNGSGLSGRKSLILLGMENGSEIVQEALENADIEKFLQPNDEVIKLLSDLKNKYSHIDLITGSNKEIAEKKLKKLNISNDIFDFKVFGEGPSKQDGGAYKLWIDYYYNRYIPEEFLYIGDRANSDFIVPNNFGINSILVNIKDVDNNLNCIQLGNLLDIKEILL